MLCWMWLFSLTTITIQKFVAANEQCNEEDWQTCKDELIALRDDNAVEDYLDGNLEQFCRVAEQNGSCWNEVSHDCKEKYPVFSTDIATYFVNKHLFCNQETDYASMHKRVSDCAANYVSEMEDCFPEGKEENLLNLSDMCQRSMNFLYCLADVGKRHCGEDGLTFGNAYQLSVQQAFASTCDNSTIILSSIEDSNKNLNLEG